MAVNGRKKAVSEIEEAFALQARALALKPVREHRFHPTRRWRFDFAFPDQMLAVEIEGGVYINGRHNRGSGFIADMEKYNEAALLGWKVLRFDGGSVRKGLAIDTVARALKEMECLSE